VLDLKRPIREADIDTHTHSATIRFMVFNRRKHRKLKAGEIGPDDGITPTQEEMVHVIEWADLRQLQLLRKIAESIEKEPLH
jgi:hypothetical protein